MKLIIAAIIISVGLVIAGSLIDIDTIVKINKECEYEYNSKSNYGTTFRF